MSLALFGAAQAQTPLRLTFQDGRFAVSGAGPDVVTPLRPTAPEILVAEGRGWASALVRGATLRVDARGLTVQTAGGTVRTTLREVPVSGRIATRTSNEALMRLVAAGERSLDVTGISGLALVGEEVLFVARWADRSGKTWLEAVMRLDLEEVRPKPRLVARIDGVSTARGLIDRVAARRAGRLAMPVNRGDGLFLLEVASDGTSSQVRLGTATARALPSDDGAQVFTLDPTPYGTVRVGVALAEGEDSLETRAELRGMPLGFVSPAYLRYRRGGETVLLNLTTGGEAVVPAGSEQRQTSAGLLSWHPAQSPTRATLFDGHLRPLATWSAPSRRTP